MRILYTTDLSHPGNDCYIHQSVSLVEAFGMYAIITADKTTGWFENEDICVHNKITTSLQKAKSMYVKAGGVITD